MPYCVNKHPFLRSQLAGDIFPIFGFAFFNLCYTDHMQVDRTLWSKWAHFLHHWGVDGIAAFLIDAGGPLTVLAAQVVYMGQPFLRQSVSEGHLQALVNLFEDQKEGQMFAAFLREGKNQ